MLWILIAQTEARRGSQRGPKDTGTASDLFGSADEDVKIYEYEIADVRLEARAYAFPAKKGLSIWRKIGRFFGNDVWQDEGRRFVYLEEEWGYYGKQGTLRNLFGELVHWPFWDVVWITLASTVAAVVVIYGSYRLVFWIKEQRELMKWDGMDDVWDRLRNESSAEEEGALLDGAYRDEPDAGEPSSRPPSYTDEPSTMKLLPSKPLPEKPLPAVPLIDA